MIPKLKGKDWININTSAQPNSNPHFGTVTTMMTVFAIAEELRDYFGVRTEVTFDQLENAPDRGINGIQKREFRGRELDYHLSLADAHTEDGVPSVEKNMVAFNKLFGFLSAQTGIKLNIRSYSQCQAEPAFRNALVQMFKQQDIFMGITAPKEDHMKLRFPCPQCKWVDKNAAFTEVTEVTSNSVRFKAICPEHGDHFVDLNPDNDDYVDTNTPLRDIAKGVLLIEKAREENSLSVMVDGRDWAGRWNNLIFSEGITRLGYKFEELPVRFYTPAITDRLGAKLSKSLYVGQNTYDYMPKGFMNYEAFLETYGMGGLQKLWSHVREWAKNPAYLDRDCYSIDYFRLLLEDNLPKVEITGQDNSGPKTPKPNMG